MATDTLWNDDWMKIQRQYWEQLSELQRSAMGLNKPATSPWEQSMNHWWGAVKDAVPPAGQDFYSRMMEQGRGFFRMAESMMQTANDHEKPAEVWTSILTSFTDSFRTATGATDFPSGTGFWEMPLDNWNRMVSVLSPVPGDILRGMPSGTAKEHLDRVLGTPGLGYTRESQAQYQSLLQAVAEYQEALAEYAMLFSSIGEQSVSLLQDKIGESPVESARQLYDTWVGCCEEVYAEKVMTSEYIELHGRLVNALMLVKSRWGEILNEYLSMYNIPTRDDLRTLQIRMQEQRRENKALSRKVNALRKTVEQLATAVADKGKPAPTSGRTLAPATKKVSKKTAKKRVTKKKVSKKKATSAGS